MKRNRPNIDPDRRYCIKEVCDMLSICRDTLRKYTNLDVIMPIRVTSREIYYLGSEVERLYEALTNTSN